MFDRDVTSYKMLHPSEQKIICADQQNPFLENKPYDPDAVMGAVIRNFGLKSTDALRAKQLYSAAVMTLKEDKKVAVSEANIIKYADDIMKTVSDADAKAEAKTKKESQDSEDEKKPCEHKRLAIRRDYVTYFVIFLVVLVVLKLILSFFKSN